MSPEESKILGTFHISVIEQEVKTTIRVFQAIPEEKRDYRPHPVSRSAMELVRHVAEEDPWILEAVINGGFPPIPDQTEASSITTVAKAIEVYSERMPPAIEKAKILTGEQLLKVIDVEGMYKYPAVYHLSLMTRHMVHHRGQLSAYLRAMGGKVPQIYGPSADEPMEMPVQAS